MDTTFVGLHKETNMSDGDHECNNVRPDGCYCRCHDDDDCGCDCCAQNRGLEDDDE
jgi:hypothetical protein